MYMLSLMLAFCLGDSGTYQADSKTACGSPSELHMWNTINSLVVLFHGLVCTMLFTRYSKSIILLLVPSFWSLLSGGNITHGEFIKEHQSTLSSSMHLSITETSFDMPSQIMHSFETIYLKDNTSSWHRHWTVIHI